MDSLDQYLTGGYLTDKQELASIERTIQEAVATLLHAYVAEAGWPYRITRLRVDTPPDSLSQSTTAMVSLSLWKLLHRWQRPKALVITPEFPPIPLHNREKIANVARSATSLLRGAIIKDGKAVTRSGTYGGNDPITLSFLAELVAVRDLPGQSTEWKPVQDYISSRTLDYRSKTAEDQRWFRNHAVFFPELAGQNPACDVVANAIIPLRVLQSIRAASEGHEQDLPAYREYFETTLHDQLSFSSIPDSRFDPAELAFCLEGLLLAQRDAVDQTLFSRVLEVLTKAQQESAFWRPNKPFMATDKGFTLFPVSVEVANSLLRSCELYDGSRLHDTFGSMSLGLFRRYWQWLRARTVRFRGPDNFNYVGWHSEHINETSSIHIWETSQVLEFLLAYHRLVQAHIARTTLILSRFSVRLPKEQDGKRPDWEDIQTGFEPVTYLGPNYRIYQQIGSDFIKGWRDHNPRNYSMLLYGPPGTGKTTVAENIADALGYRMITITVSDFLAGGGAQLEARAKAIFDVLIAQSNCVILFDEIDNFLLDRDSTRYTKQDSAFQFMTPGMLTKLNDLRREKRVLFVIATNYENRIDPAIKRTGRIDKRYLVLPPDGEARCRMLKTFLRDTDSESRLHPTRITNWDRLKRTSLFLGFKDIEGAVVDTLNLSGATEENLCRALEERARTTNVSMYASKLTDKLDRDRPVEEFFTLMGLALEADPELLREPASRTAIAAAAIFTEGATDTLSGVKAVVPGLPPETLTELASELDSTQKS